MVNRAVPLNFFKIALCDFGLVICIVFILLIRPIFAGECINGNCVNGYGTKIWPNGGKYTGEWKNGLPHGQGTVGHLPNEWVNFSYF